MSQPGRVGCPRLARPNKSGRTPATVGRFAPADRLRSGHGGARDCADPGIATSGWFAAPTPGTCRGSGTARRPVRAGVAVAAGRVPRLAAFVVLSLIVGQIVTRIGDMLGTPVARQLITALGGVGELTKAFVAAELSFVAVFRVGVRHQFHSSLAE